MTADNHHPSILWHYTTLDVLQSIVVGRELYATNIRHMNDAGEFKRVRETCHRLITDHFIPNAPSFIPDAGVRVVVAVLELLKSWSGISHPPSWCILSFSSIADHLNQWRAYCKLPPGVSIGFDSDQLVPLATEAGFRMVECEYHTDSQVRSHITTLLESHLKSLSTHLLWLSRTPPAEQVQPIREAALSIWNPLQEFALRSKHHSFFEEREFRLVADDSYDDRRRTRVRSRNGLLIPYIPLALPKAPAELPFAQIWLGPTTDKKVQELHHHALTELFLSHRLTFRGFSLSQIPFRQ